MNTFKIALTSIILFVLAGCNTTTNIVKEKYDYPDGTQKTVTSCEAGGWNGERPCKQIEDIDTFNINTHTTDDKAVGQAAVNMAAWVEETCNKQGLTTKQCNRLKESKGVLTSTDECAAIDDVKARHACFINRGEEAVQQPKTQVRYNN